MPYRLPAAHRATRLQDPASSRPGGSSPFCDRSTTSSPSYLPRCVPHPPRRLCLRSGTSLREIGGTGTGTVPSHPSPLVRGVVWNQAVLASRAALGTTKQTSCPWRAVILLGWFAVGSGWGKPTGRARVRPIPLAPSGHLLTVVDPRVLAGWEREGCFASSVAVATIQAQKPPYVPVPPLAGKKVGPEVVVQFSLELVWTPHEVPASRKARESPSQTLLVLYASMAPQS